MLKNIYKAIFVPGATWRVTLNNSPMVCNLYLCCYVKIRRHPQNRKYCTVVRLGPSHIIWANCYCKHFDNKVLIFLRGEWHPTLLWPNGWMDEDATWYGSRPPRRPHCIRRVPSAPRKAHSIPPLLDPCLLWPRSPISATAELLLRYASGKIWRTECDIQIQRSLYFAPLPVVK